MQKGHRLRTHDHSAIGKPQGIFNASVQIRTTASDQISRIGRRREHVMQGRHDSDVSIEGGRSPACDRGRYEKNGGDKRRDETDGKESTQQTPRQRPAHALIGLQYVANATHGGQYRRAFPVPNRMTQTTDMHVNHVGLRVKVVPPHLFQQHPAGHGLRR